MKPIHFDVEEDGFYGAYWACKDTHTAAGTDSIETCRYLILNYFIKRLFYYRLLQQHCVRIHGALRQKLWGRCA